MPEHPLDDPRPRRQVDPRLVEGAGVALDQPRPVGPGGDPQPGEELADESEREVAGDGPGADWRLIGDLVRGRTPGRVYYTDVY